MTVIIPAVTTCRKCGNKTVCWGGYCIQELVVAVGVLDRAEGETVAPMPAEFLEVAEKLIGCAQHKPKCRGWQTFRFDEASCDCGVYAILARARAMLKSP